MSKQVGKTHHFQITRSNQARVKQTDTITSQKKPFFFFFSSLATAKLQNTTQLVLVVSRN